MSREPLFDAMVDWHRRRFPDRPSIERIGLKLGEETGELLSAILLGASHGDDGKGSVREELADVLACLAVIAHRHGIDLIEAGWDKLATLEARLVAPAPSEPRGEAP